MENAKLLTALKDLVACVSESDEMDHMLDSHEPETCALCQAREVIASSQTTETPVNQTLLSACKLALEMLNDPNDDYFKATNLETILESAIEEAERG